MKIEFSTEAMKDMRQVFDYISDELFDPAAAEKIIKRIFDRIEDLKEFPSSGKMFIDQDDNVTKYRYITTSKKWIVFYEASDELLIVHRVVGAGQDYINYL